METKRRSLKEIKLQPSKTHYLKAIKRFLIYEYLRENKAYVLTLRTYSVGESELNKIKSKENPTSFDKFAIEESGDHKKPI